jgi:hypothetical protein
MNQDVTISKALESIGKQLGGLTPRQISIIGEHLHLVYTSGVEDAYKIINRPNKRAIISTDSKGNERPFPSISEAVRILRVDRACIYKNIKGKRNHVKGYKFRYDKDIR